MKWWKNRSRPYHFKLIHFIIIFTSFRFSSHVCVNLINERTDSLMLNLPHPLQFPIWLFYYSSCLPFLQKEELYYVSKKQIYFTFYGRIVVYERPIQSSSLGTTHHSLYMKIIKSSETSSNCNNKTQDYIINYLKILAFVGKN